MMDSSIFVVNEEPWCLWGVDLKNRNLDFLNGLDTEYFKYLVDVHLDAEDEARAAIALRSTLHHAMETMFSLLGAYIQAPGCVYAWLAKCSNSELRNLVESISKRTNVLHSQWPFDEISWQTLSQAVHHAYGLDPKPKAETIDAYARTWARMAGEFLNPSHIDEYNSIKHGFRIRAGGHSMRIGKELEYGVPAPPENMHQVGSSKYGTTYYKIESIGEGKGNRSVRSTQHSLNWRFDKTVLLIQLAAMSISNITSALRIANGVDPGLCKFLRPVDGVGFDEPWSLATGLLCSNIDYAISEDDIQTCTKSDLLARLPKSNDTTNGQSD